MTRVDPFSKGIVVTDNRGHDTFYCDACVSADGIELYQEGSTLVTMAGPDAPHYGSLATCGHESACAVNFQLN